MGEWTGREEGEGKGGEEKNGETGEGMERKERT